MMPHRRMLRQSVLVIAACLSAATLHPASANVAGDAALPTAQGGTKSISQLRGGLQVALARPHSTHSSAWASARALGSCLAWCHKRAHCANSKNRHGSLGSLGLSHGSLGLSQAPAARAILRDRNAPAAARAPLAERDVADLSGARRDIAIFTTAALPVRGTPLPVRARAAPRARRADGARCGCSG